MKIRTLLNLARVAKITSPIRTLELTDILSEFNSQELDLELSSYVERFRKREFGKNG